MHKFPLQRIAGELTQLTKCRHLLERESNCLLASTHSIFQMSTDYMGSLDNLPNLNTCSGVDTNKLMRLILPKMSFK